MRTRFIAVAATLCATMPASAQEATKVYHGDGYEVTLPAVCEPGQWSATNEAADMQPIDCGGRQRAMFVTRVRATGAPDTTRATRVAAFAGARQGMAQEFGSADALSAGTEFKRPDRLGWRMDLQLGANQQTFRGRAEISFDRKDNQRMWILVYLDRTGAADTMAAAERILDSFRITRAEAGAPPAPAATPR